MRAIKQEAAAGGKLCEGENGRRGIVVSHTSAEALGAAEDKALQRGRGLWR